MSEPRRSLPARPNVIWRLFVVSQLVGTLLEREFARLELTARDFAVLSTIGATTAITPRDLAELLGMPATTLSAVLKRLEEPGAVRRRRNPEDGRSVLLELTAEGRARMEAAAPALRRAVAALDEALEAPVDQLQDALEAYERAARRALDGTASS